MANAPLPAHSLAEAFFYVMVTPCPACGEGSLKAGDARCGESVKNGVRFTLPVRCAKCGKEQALEFLLPSPPERKPADGVTVNATSEPSRIIDLAQWVTLAHVIIEAASRESDKQQARHLGLEAAQCLEEALKFFEEDNDLPMDGAFFSDASRRRFAQQPQQFSRQRLIHVRAKLPTTTVMRSRLSTNAKKKRKWWPWS